MMGRLDAGGGGGRTIIWRHISQRWMELHSAVPAVAVTATSTAVSFVSCSSRQSILEEGA